MRLRAYACSVKGMDWGETITHSIKAGRARYLHLLYVREGWEGIRYEDIRSRVIGAPRDTPKFLHTAKYRGVNFHIGDRVRVGDSIGLVADSNSTACFSVEFIEGRFAGLRLSVHPSEISEAVE